MLKESNTESSQELSVFFSFALSDKLPLRVTMLSYFMASWDRFDWKYSWIWSLQSDHKNSAAWWVWIPLHNYELVPVKCFLLIKNIIILTQGSR